MAAEPQGSGNVTFVKMILVNMTFQTVPKSWLYYNYFRVWRLFSMYYNFRFVYVSERGRAAFSPLI